MKNTTTLNEKQTTIIENLNSEDQQWLGNIVITHKRKPFTILFSFSSTIVSQQSFFRMFLLRELWYVVLKYEEKGTDIEVTFQLQ